MTRTSLEARDSYLVAQQIAERLPGNDDGSAAPAGQAGQGLAAGMSWEVVGEGLSVAGAREVFDLTPRPPLLKWDRALQERGRSRVCGQSLGAAGRRLASPPARFPSVGPRTSGEGEK